ncbi:MAG: DUF721 domain-containing protein [Fimbriimonadaceae bacterium]|jgi:predicted nucleic acid-binding Zn ribbon protein|nr:DUF721 domain-containing protein [Fimbriimonadaceae bacterium]
MKRLSEVLAGSLDRPEVLKAAKAQMVMRRWEEVVGPTLAEHCQPERYDHGTVWVRASGSAWAQEIRTRQEDIVSRLNQLAQESGLFMNLRVGVRPWRNH